MSCDSRLQELLPHWAQCLPWDEAFLGSGKMVIIVINHTLLSSSALYGDATRQKKKQKWILHKQFFKTRSSHRKKQISGNWHREPAELIFFPSECFLSQYHSGSCFKFSPTQHQHATLSARYCWTQIKFYMHYMAVSFSRSFSTSCSLSPNFSAPSFNILFPSETKDNKYNGRDSDYYFSHVKLASDNNTDDVFGDGGGTGGGGWGWEHI